MKVCISPINRADLESARVLSDPYVSRLLNKIDIICIWAFTKLLYLLRYLNISEYLKVETNSLKF